MRGRTVILVSHHVQLCAPGASYIVALDNGRVQFQGDRAAFYSSDVLGSLVQSGSSATRAEDEAQVPTAEEIADAIPFSTPTPETAISAQPKLRKKAPRKFIEEEKRAVGRIGKEVWGAYLIVCGQRWYWILFIAVLLLADLSPIAEKGWLT